MTTAYRPPIGTTASIDDFRASDWNGDTSSDRSYHSWWNFLWNRGFEAIQAGEFAKAKVLWLLGDACSLRLQPSNRTEPLVATQVNEFQRPINLDSFEDADIELLARIYPEVENVVLKARLAGVTLYDAQPDPTTLSIHGAQGYWALSPLKTQETWPLVLRHEQTGDAW